MATTFARLGYRNAANNFEAVNLRAQDVVDTRGITVEAHTTDDPIHLGVDRVQTAHIRDGAVTPAKLSPEVVGGLAFQGSWDAATNTPALPATPAQSGQYWICRAAGTQFGITFVIGDYLVAGATWDRIAREDLVRSVAGRQGDVVLAAGDITSGTFAVNRGGTNRSSQATGNINYATSATATGVIAAPSATAAQALVHPVQAVATPPAWRNLTGATSLRNDMGLGTGNGMLTNADIGLGNVTNNAQTTGVTAGNGLTGGGTSGALTLTMGTPGDITATSANGVTAESHTHNLANTGVVAAAVGPTGNVSPGSAGTFTVPQVTVAADGRLTALTGRTITLPASTNNVGTLTGVTAGNGLTGGGTTGNPTITLGAPGDLNASSTSGVTASGHTHAVSGFDVAGSAAAVANSIGSVITSAEGATVAAKTAALAGFVRRVGSIVWVRFNTANTATNPTLNVGGTGAAAIMADGQLLNSANLARQINANVTYGFIFDGTNWNMLVPATNKPTMGTGWGTMVTAAATAAKVGTMAGFIRRTGSMIALQWSATPTALTTLNVNGTGAVAIHHAGVAVTAANGNHGMLQGGRVYWFIFDGTNWQLLNPAIENIAPIDAAFVTSEAQMQGMNLRTGALVLMQVGNVTLNSTSESAPDQDAFELDLGDAEMEPCENEPENVEEDGSDE